MFFDTLLARLAPEEIEAVLAHELGHFRLRHVRQAGGAGRRALSLAALALLALACDDAVVLRGPRHAAVADRCAVARPGVALLLFMLALPAFTFVLAPLARAYSRRHEFEADAFAATHASAARSSRH